MSSRLTPESAAASIQCCAVSALPAASDLRTSRYQLLFELLLRLLHLRLVGRNRPRRLNEETRIVLGRLDELALAQAARSPWRDSR